jgi:hypothetical protein
MTWRATSGRPCVKAEKAGVAVEEEVAAAAELRDLSLMTPVGR